jgi:8-oxo-dGTP diphosphatase
VGASRIPMLISGAQVLLHRMIATHSQHTLCAVLLCKRTHDAPIFPGYWSLFGGWVEKGEDAKEAAIREVQEELGIALPRSRLKHLSDVLLQRGTPKPTSVRYFSCPLDLEMDGLRLQRNREEDKVEAEALGWFTAEEINHLLVKPADRSAIDLFYRQHGY